MSIPASTACDDSGTADGDCSNEVAGDQEAITTDVNGDTGPLTLQNPVPAGSHTIKFTLAAGVSYCSDGGDASPRTFDSDPTTGDAVVTPAANVSSPLSNSGTDEDAQGVASVGVTGVPGDTVTVDLYTQPQSDAPGSHDDGCDVSTVTISFAALADLEVGTAAIRHVDVDCASERAADAGGDDYDGNVLDCNGLLSNGDVSSGVNAVDGYALDDPDDAIGSMHTVCIIGGALTSDDNPNITWDVHPTATHQQPSDVNLNGKTGVDVSGNSDLEPCVQWRVGDVGVEQDISAVWTPTGETIFSNGVQSTAADSVDCENFSADPCTHNLCPSDVSNTDEQDWEVCQPLIKQWNSIDDTIIVQASGDVGGDVGDTIFNNTPNTDLSDWSGRNCTDSGICARLDLDGQTLTVPGSVFDGPGQTPGTLLATGRSFIDYARGSHANYDGPIDGVEQTYSFSGDCGSAKVEDPSTGEVWYLYPGDYVTLPTNSDKGVGFTITPSSDGDITVDDTNLSDADCQDGETSTMTISSVESTSF